MKYKTNNLIFPILGIVLMFLLWWMGTLDPDSSLHRFNPKDTFIALSQLPGNPRFWEGLFQTLQRLFIGLGIATIIGVPVGLLVGYFSKFNQITYIPFQFLRMISPLSWTPVAIIIFGLDSGPVYFLISIAAVWPIIINTAAGVQSADKQWLQVARTLGADDKGIFRHILFRASLPHVLTGLQLALGVAWIVLVPAEMLGVSSGLGYMILDYRDINGYDFIMATIIVIGILGILTDLPLRLAINYFRWN